MGIRYAGQSYGRTFFHLWRSSYGSCRMWQRLLFCITGLLLLYRFLLRLNRLPVYWFLYASIFRSGWRLSSLLRHQFRPYNFQCLHVRADVLWYRLHILWQSRSNSTGYGNHLLLLSVRPVWLSDNRRIVWYCRSFGESHCPFYWIRIPKDWPEEHRWYRKCLPNGRIPLLLCWTPR